MEMTLVTKPNDLYHQLSKFTFPISILMKVTHKKHIPDQMKAIVLESFSGVDGLKVEERPVPKPGKDEVLVKVHASPINPSDIAVLEGRYGFKLKLPIIPGGEGSGTVVAAGPGYMGRYFLGKRVACLWNGKEGGVWAEYMTASVKGGVLPLHKSVDLQNGALSTINPLTAMSFIEIAKKDQHKSFVLTAAASSLGQMINRLSLKNKILVINVVRRESQVELLKKQGAKVVLVSSEPDFNKKLFDACHKHDTHRAFDAVSGPLTGQLAEAMPEHSKVTIFGGLSFENAVVPPDQYIFYNKIVDGFWLGPSLRKKSLFQILKMWRHAQSLQSSDLKSQVRAQFPLDDAKTAINDYLNQMTGGKVLFKMGDT